MNFQEKLEQFKTNLNSPKITPKFLPIFQLLIKSKTFDIMADNSELVCNFDKQVAQSSIIGNQLLINPNQESPVIWHDLCKLLRIGGNHSRNLNYNILEYDPDDAIHYNRAMEFDALAHTIKIAWEIKLAGNFEFWDYIIQRYPTQAVPFKNLVQTDFRMLNNGQGLRLAYDYMYSHSFVVGVDKKAIQHMLANNDYVSNQSNKKLDSQFFAKLGETTHGRNYMGHGISINPLDVAYKMVENRSNANFLWFIKFERSFNKNSGAKE